MLYYKPVTPSQRHLCLVNKRILERKLFINSLFHSKIKSIGRDNTGKITVYHKEFGHKKLFRFIDFLYNKNIPYIIESIEYDPNRSSFINLISYKNGIYSYILATENNKCGNFYICTTKMIDFLKNGNRTLLLNIPIGSIIHNISTSFLNKSQYLRSAGVYGTLLKKENNLAYIKLPSSTKIYSKINIHYLYSSLFGLATLGRTSNIYYRNIKIGKAGRSRWLGIRPTVRGVAMNPVDHPHGGGEGKKSKKASPTNKWGTVIKFSRKYKRKKN